MLTVPNGKSFWQLCLFYLAFYSCYGWPSTTLWLGTRKFRRDYDFIRQGFLHILALKEKRQEKRVTKVIMIHLHTDSPLYSIAIFEEYKHRIVSPDCHIAHPLFPKIYQLFSATSANFSLSTLDQQSRSSLIRVMLCKYAYMKYWTHYISKWSWLFPLSCLCFVFLSHSRR